MWVPFAKQMAFYNASNNPIKLDEYIYNFTSFPPTPDFTTRYYYESFNDTTAGIFSASVENKLLIYPNPAADKIQIKGFEKNNTQINVRLFDVCGRLQSQQLTTTSGESIEIPLNTLSPGMYFVVLEDEKGKLIHREPFVKIK